MRGEMATEPAVQRSHHGDRPILRIRAGSLPLRL
jgi:hypothetical protein